MKPSTSPSDRELALTADGFKRDARVKESHQARRAPGTQVREPVVVTGESNVRRGLTSTSATLRG
jgi:hypothetical protein